VCNLSNILTRISYNFTVEHVLIKNYTMKNLLIYPNSHHNTPVIDFKASGELSLTGRSVSEKISEYYQPAIDWLTELMFYPPATIVFSIKLECFNTKSSMIILHILKMLEEIHSKRISKVKVNWIYEDDDTDMFESGNDYQSLVKLPFKLLSLVDC